MTDLYIVFLIAGIFLYLFIVLYSVWQNKQRDKPVRKDSAMPDPLLSPQKNNTKSSNNKEDFENQLADKNAKDNASEKHDALAKATRSDSEATRSNSKVAPAKKAGELTSKLQGLLKKHTKNQKQSADSETNAQAKEPEDARVAPSFDQDGEQQGDEQNPGAKVARASNANLESPVSGSEQLESSRADNVNSANGSKTQVLSSRQTEQVQSSRELESDRLVSDPERVKSNSTLNANELETELVARIKNTKPIEQRELLALFREYDYKFNRKVHIYGLNELTDLWRDVEFELPSARFVALGVSIQLADRNGAISKKEFHDFQQMSLAFTERFDAPFEFSMDVEESKEHAAQLAMLTERYESMAVLNIVPRNKTGFRAADIESCARDLMMSMDAQGVFLKTRGQKKNLSVLYRLACPDGSGHFGIKPGSTSPVHDLVMYMNVPATQSPEIVFQEMFADAKKLATWLDGKVVDRHGKVMTQRSYEVLIKQIADIVYNMEREGVVPGGALSKKLF